MKPVNSQDLRVSYQRFFLFFSLLVAFSVLCVYFFYITSKKEIIALDIKVKESERLMSIRSDINADFDLIMLRMQQLTDYTKMNANELNNQSLLLDDIQKANQKIRGRIMQNKNKLASFDLYQKMSDDIAVAASIKDSLFTSRFQIESLRSQLNSCNKTNRSAANRLRGGF